MKQKQGLFQKKFWDYVTYISCIIFFVAGSLISVNRYWQYDVFYYDFGIFDRAIWLVSRFQAPIVDHVVIGGKWIFADHFNPSIFLLSPIYWFTNRSEALLIAQAFAVAASGLVVYLIGKRILNNKFLSFSVTVSYFLFLGLQNAIITDFHEVTVATLFIALTFWAFLEKKKLLYFLFLAVTLGFKESMFLYGIFLAITIILIEKKISVLSLLTFFISAIWGFLSIKVIIPHFSGGFYLYYVPLNVNLLEVIKSLIDHPEKRRTIYLSLASFGFLPVFSPITYLLLIQDFFERFYANVPTRWSLAFHYNATISPILAISSLYGLKNISSIFKKIPISTYAYSVFLIFLSLYLYRFPLNGPFGLFYNKAFYRHTQDFRFLNNMVKKVPSTDSVMAQNNLSSHFTHQKVWLLKKDYESLKPDYILADIRDGQNEINFFYSPEIKEIVDLLKKDSNYELVYTTNEQFVFKRK